MPFYAVVENKTTQELGNPIQDVVAYKGEEKDTTGRRDSYVLTTVLDKGANSRVFMVFDGNGSDAEVVTIVEEAGFLNKLAFLVSVGFYPITAYVEYYTERQKKLDQLVLDVLGIDFDLSSFPKLKDSMELYDSFTKGLSFKVKAADIRAVLNNTVPARIEEIDKEIKHWQDRANDLGPGSDLRKEAEAKIKVLEKEKEVMQSLSGEDLKNPDFFEVECLVDWKYQETRKELKTQEQKSSGGTHVSTPTLDFGDMVPDEDLDAFINALNLEIFTQVTDKEVKKEITLALEQIYAALQNSVPMVLQNTLSTQVGEEGTLKKSIDATEAEIKELRRLTKEGFTKENRQQATKSLAEAITTLAYLKEVRRGDSFFYEGLRGPRTKVIGDTGSANEAEKKRSGTFGDFAWRYRKTVEAISDRLEKSRPKRLRRKGNQGGVKDGEEEVEPKPGLGLTPQNADLEAQIANQNAENQLIKHLGVSGTNTFDNHQPYDQILSILDVMRKETGETSFEEEVTVKEEVRDDSEVKKGSESACSNAFSKFTLPEISAMKLALDNKIEFNKKNISKLSFKLNRIQGLPQFKFMSAFTGFKGLPFSLSDIDNFFEDFDFDKTKNDLKKAIASLKRLSMPDIGNSFGFNVSLNTGVIKGAALDLFGKLPKTSFSVDFSRAFDKLSFSEIKLCPNLSKFKKLMENPGNLTTSVLDGAKEEVAKVAKISNLQIDQIKTFSDQNKELKEGKKFLESESLKAQMDNFQNKTKSSSDASLRNTIEKSITRLSSEETKRRVSKTEKLLEKGGL